MKFQRILFPTDFSHDNDAALAYASTIAAESGALLYIVHVDEALAVSPSMGEAGFVYPMAYDAADRAAVRDQLSRVLPTIESVRYEHHYLQGSAVNEIVKFARREHVELIVMASHGRTGLSRLLMGSVAEGVLRKAPCPVLIVKQPAIVPESTNDPSSHVLL